MSAPEATGVAAEQVLGKAYDLRLMRRVWVFVRPHWRLFIASLVLIPVMLAFELAQPYLLKIAIEDYIAVRRLDGLELIALAYVGLVLGQSLSQYVQLLAIQLLGQRSMHDLRLATYRHVITRRAAFFDRIPIGRLLTRMTNDVENINEMFASGVVTLVADIVKLLAIVVIMFTLDVRLTLMTFITLPALFALVVYARKVMRGSFREIRVRLAAMNAFVSEHLSGLKVVQLFRRERAAAAAYGEINAGYRDAYLGAIRADSLMYALVEAIGIAAVASIAWYAGGNIGETGLTIGLVVAFIEYINKFFMPVRDLSAKYTVMQSAMAATERIMALLDTEEPDAPPRAATERPLDSAPSSARVEFRDVQFAYREGDPVLRGVSFAIQPGQTVAVVGATGSGKSTLIKLLARLYDPQGGDILVDGRDVRDLDLSELRRAITVVSQDVMLFSGTIADNVRLGNLDASDAQVEAALARVGADRMLSRRGVDASEEVAERGVNFSAGERQLIAFARAIVRNPAILVLDEATAHVDPEAEGLIERGIEELMRGRTTLVIAHRLSTIRNADRIIVMSRGRIVESGTHDELVAAGGVYAALERTFSRHP